jgi:hypothetical protein
MFEHERRWVKTSDKIQSTRRYAFVDVYTTAYVADYRNFDLAVVTLQEPIGLKAGWMGVRALPPTGTCDRAEVTLPSLQVVGYPVEADAANYPYTDTCDLQVRSLTSDKTMSDEVATSGTYERT